MPNSLLIVHVDVAVVPGGMPAFLAATEANATASRLEPGVVRFDVLADRDDPAHVALVEVYLDEEAAAAHKRTAHYAAWSEAVTPLMAAPRTRARYVNVSPDDAGFGAGGDTGSGAASGAGAAGAGA